MSIARPRPAPNADQAAAAGPSRRSSILLGALTGLIGIGCCVYPVVLVMVGASSAAAAVGLGNYLYDTWGWAFKLAGAVFAVSAVLVQRRLSRRACPPGARPRTLRSVLILAGVAVVTYGALWFATKGLEILARGS